MQRTAGRSAFCSSMTSTFNPQPRAPSPQLILGLVRAMRALALVLLSLAFTACDPAYGVWRRAYVGHMPDPSKVRAIIQNTPSVDKVVYRHYHGGFPPTTEEYFDYSGGSNVHGELRFAIDSRQRIQYSQTCMSLGEPPAQRYIDATLPIMKRIELRLERDAGVSGLQGSVTQDCIRVVCP